MTYLASPNDGYGQNRPQPAPRPAASGGGGKKGGGGGWGGGKGGAVASLPPFAGVDSVATTPPGPTPQAATRPAFDPHSSFDAYRAAGEAGRIYGHNPNLTREEWNTPPPR